MSPKWPGREPGVISASCRRLSCCLREGRFFQIVFFSSVFGGSDRSLYEASAAAEDAGKVILTILSAGFSTYRLGGGARCPLLRSGLFTPLRVLREDAAGCTLQRSQGPAEPGTGRPLEALSVSPGHLLHPRRCLGPRGHRDCPAVMQPRNTCCLPVGQSTRGPGGRRGDRGRKAEQGRLELRLG